MSDIDIAKSVEDFADILKATDIYKEYAFQKEKIKRQPELFEKVNEFRQRNFDLQNESDSEELFERMEAFNKEAEKFRENPLVDDFLSAELAFCRMMQEVYAELTLQMDFE